MNRDPAFVPLPQVAHYTEDVIFGALNLPVGFDEERLLVNVRAFDRARSLGGIGLVTVTTKSGRANDTWVSGRVNNDGAMSLSAAGVQKPTPLSKGSVTFPAYPGSFFGKARLSIVIDNTRISEETKRADVPNAAFDARLKGRLLNRAVQHGLHQGVRAANIDLLKTGLGAVFYANSGATFSYVLQDIPTGAAMAFALGPFIQFGALMTEKKRRHAPQGDERWYRSSFFVGCALDRYAAGAAAVALGTFIKAR